MRPPPNACARTSESSGSGFGLGGILAVLGAVLLGAAIVSLVAANWEAMPRLFRVGLIMSVLSLAMSAARGGKVAATSVFSQALYLIAAITFGAGIALIGQMYHLSGDACGCGAALGRRHDGCGIVPALARAGLGERRHHRLYLFCSLEPATGEPFNYLWLVPVLLFICAGLIWYTKGKAARHLIALLLITYVLVVRIRPRRSHGSCGWRRSSVVHSS